MSSVECCLSGAQVTSSVGVGGIDAKNPFTGLAAKIGVCNTQVNVTAL